MDNYENNVSENENGTLNDNSSALKDTAENVSENQIDTNLPTDTENKSVEKLAEEASNSEASDDSDDIKEEEVKDEPAFSKEDFTAKPKRTVIMPGIKVAFSVLLVSVIAVAIYFVFFNYNIKGTWVTAENENGDARTTLSFKENGVVEMTVGSVTIKGDYSFLDSDNGINISIVYSSTSFMYGDFTYKITGNALTGKTLEITDDNGNSLKMNSGKAPSVLSPAAERKYTQKLVGTWKNDNMSYTFTDDGYMYLDYNYITFECTYSDDGSKIAASYYAPIKNDIEIEFSFTDDDTVTIDGLEFTRVKE